MHPSHLTMLVSERAQQSQPQLTRLPDRKDALQRTYGGVYSLRDLKVCLDRTQKLQCPKVDKCKFLLVDPNLITGSICAD